MDAEKMELAREGWGKSKGDASEFYEAPESRRQTHQKNWKLDDRDRSSTCEFGLSKKYLGAGPGLDTVLLLRAHCRRQQRLFGD
jgi:hypothetical protein